MIEIALLLLIGTPLAARGLYCMFLKKIPPGWEHLGDAYRNIGESISLSFTGLGLITLAVLAIRHRLGQ